MGTIHAADLEKSQRMQRLFNLLEKRGQEGATTWEFQSVARVCSGSTVASELRAYLRKIGSPFTVGDAEYEGKSDTGKIYRYRLVHAITGEGYTQGTPA